MSLTMDGMLAIVKPHNDKIVAEHRVAEAGRSLDLIIGELGAARVQRSTKDDAIIADHVEQAYQIAIAAKRRLKVIGEAA